MLAIICLVEDNYNMMTFPQSPEGAGIELAKALAQEAVLECTDPVHGQMVSMVKFHDPERPDMLMGDYLEVLFFLGNYATAQSWGRTERDYFEQAFYDALDEQDALRDLTVGPY